MPKSLRPPFPALPRIPPVAGVRVAGVAAGLKDTGAKDLFVAELAQGTTIAGTLTRSLCPGASVEWSRARLAEGRARAIVASSGNANVFTGRQGRELVEETARAAAGLVGCRKEQVFIASTGRIGEKREREFVAAKLPLAVRRLRNGGWATAAESIMTTDRFPKAAFRKARIGNSEVLIAGIAKGSTMIRPDMATMLSFIFTDAKLPARVLQTCLDRAVGRSFNCISVDGDTSTSDTVLLAATGKGPRHPAIERAGDRALRDFRAALDGLTHELADMIVRDGAVSGRIIAATVTGATSEAAARNIGHAIVNSTLVRKSADIAEARCGRIVMAVGKAGEKADRDRLSIAMGGVRMAEAGEELPEFDAEAVIRHLKEGRVEIAVDLGLGRGRARVWAAL